nr:riorf15 [Ipomoea batatas]GMD17095.1 riorf15 [Ipomoea batatas]GMD17099.1 riorf15 [Ipomoea batatas]GMD17100.1 riorf15 [Ipomoea batatas]
MSGSSSSRPWFAPRYFCHSESQANLSEDINFTISAYKTLYYNAAMQYQRIWAQEILDRPNTDPDSEALKDVAEICMLKLCYHPSPFHGFPDLAREVDLLVYVNSRQPVKTEQKKATLSTCGRKLDFGVMMYWLVATRASACIRGCPLFPSARDRSRTSPCGYETSQEKRGRIVELLARLIEPKACFP